MNNPPFHILLADDDEADRFIFTEAFSELKIQTIVKTVNDGDQLMEYLGNADNKMPHILFLDLNMPRKNGLECLKEIRSNEQFKDVSIAIYSTSDNEKDMEETFQGGANVYITKPADFNTLKQVLERAVMTAYHFEQKGMNRDNFLLKI